MTMFKVQFVKESGKTYNSGSFNSLFDAISFMKELQSSAYNALVDKLPSANKNNVMKLDNDAYIACYVSYQTVREYRVVRVDENGNIYRINYDLTYEKED